MISHPLDSFFNEYERGVRYDTKTKGYLNNSISIKNQHSYGEYN